MFLRIILEGEAGEVDSIDFNGADFESGSAD